MLIGAMEMEVVQPTSDMTHYLAHHRKQSSVFITLHNTFLHDPPRIPNYH